MILAIEIILVAAAFLVLVASGVTTVKSALGFGKTTRRVMGDVEPKAMDLISRADEASRRAMSIAEMRDVLLARVASVRLSVAKMLISLRAILDVKQQVSRFLAYFGH